MEILLLIDHWQDAIYSLTETSYWQVQATERYLLQIEVTEVEVTIVAGWHPSVTGVSDKYLPMPEISYWQTPVNRSYLQVIGQIPL